MHSAFHSISNLVFLFCEFRIRIRPRFLIDVSKRDLRCNVLGTNLDFPIAIAPTAMQKMAHLEGEKATAKGILFDKYFNFK